MKRTADKLIMLGYLLAPASFFFSRKFLIVSIVFILIGWILTVFGSDEKVSNIKFELRYLLLFFPFLIGFAGFVIDTINEEIYNSLKLLETLTPVLLMPVLIYLTVDTTRSNLIKISYVICLMVAISVCLGFAIYKNIYFHDELVHNWNFIETLDFYDKNPVGIINWGYFAYSELTDPLHIDPVYFGLFSVVGILILYQRAEDSQSRKTKIIGIMGVLILIIFAVLVGAKMPLIILFIYATLLFIFKLYKQRSVKAGLPYLLFFIFFSTLMMAIPSTRYRMISVVNDTISSINLKTEEIDQHQDMHRIYLWKTSVNIAKENILFGNGLYGSKQKLESRYVSNSRPYFNSHSEYINALLIFGLPGLGLTIISISLLLFTSFKQGGTISLFFFLAIGMIMLTENCFSRFFGTSIYGCLAPIFFIKFNSNE